MVAPGVRYEKPGGGLYKSKDIRLTYVATGAMCNVDMWGLMDTSQGRSLAMINQPARAPLVFLGRQRPQKDGYSRTVVNSVIHPEVVADLAASRAEDTQLFNFDLGTMPVLMADGHVKTVGFQQLRELVTQEAWEAKY